MLSVLLFPVALLLALPAVSDLLAFTSSRIRKRRTPAVDPGEDVKLTFLIPAHNEELLIGRCVRSIVQQDMGEARHTVIVIADNCSDATAAVARKHGATVLERESAGLRGKNHAIEWALGRLQEPWDAVVIVDGDSVCDPGFGAAISRVPGIRSVAIQAYDGLDNEFDNDLTRLAGVFTRIRYEIVLPLKRAAGLNCPLTGNGVAIGREVIEQWGWRPRTVTEGWELYARYTLAGVRCVFLENAMVRAQEARDLQQSGTQRTRWTSGRMQVLREFGFLIVRAHKVPILQRVDLLAEMSSLGPVTRGALGALGVGASVLWGGPLAGVLMLLFATTVVQPAVYTAIVLSSHPQPLRTVRASLYLLPYSVWRVGTTLKSLLSKTGGKWTRTKRHATPESGERGP